MAKCNLVVDHRLHVRGNPPNDFQDGIQKLQREVAKNHKAANWWHFSMKHFPEFTDKVWRWDFAPPSDHASTRPGWRIFAYVPDHRSAEPILAQAFVCWDKQLEPKNNYIPFLAKVLRGFLAKPLVEIRIEENTWIDRVDQDGIMHSLCEKCYYPIHSADLNEVDLMKDAHNQECPGHPPE